MAQEIMFLSLVWETWIELTHLRREPKDESSVSVSAIIRFVFKELKAYKISKKKYINLFNMVVL